MTADVDTVINRIITIIEKKNVDDSLGLRNVKYAEPDYDVYDDPHPYCFVKLARDFQSTENKIGYSLDGVDPQQIIQLEIGIIGFGKNITEAQKMQLPITNAIKQALYNNRTLTDPENDEDDDDTDDDPLAIRLNIIRISRLESKLGKEITGSLISLQIITGILNQIKIIDDDTIIPILEMVGSDSWSTEDIPDDDGKRDVGPITFSSKRIIKYHTNDSLKAALELILSNAKPITIFLMQGDTTTEHNIFLKRISPTIELNGQLLSTMEIEILK